MRGRKRGAQQEIQAGGRVRKKHPAIWVTLKGRVVRPRDARFSAASSMRFCATPKTDTSTRTSSAGLRNRVHPPVRSDEHAGILSANMPVRILSMLLQAFSPFGTRMTPVYAGARKNGHDLLPHQHLQRALVLGCGVSPGAQDQVSLSLAESAKSSMLYLLPREPHLTSRRRASILA